jgi:SAGA-associated factor 29
LKGKESFAASPTSTAKESNEGMPNLGRSFNMQSLKVDRYEIRDSDPDPPTPPLPYRASVNHLVPIPPANSSLPDIPAKKQVLALYPGTTTFYKAEVVLPKVKKPSVGGEAIRDGHGELKDGYVRLRFEGEEEAEREMDVERRYVLSEIGK